jgi:Rrf2 family protein
MNFRKSTRYALYAAMEMARAGDDGQVTATQVARRYGIPVAVLSKIFQQLVRAGFAVSTRGAAGGYGLATKSTEITVLDLIDAFESPRATGHCLLEGEREGEGICDEFALCRLRKLVDEVDEMARCTYASVTLETLVGNRPSQDLELHVVQ